MTKIIFFHHIFDLISCIKVDFTVENWLCRDLLFSRIPLEGGGARSPLHNVTVRVEREGVTRNMAAPQDDMFSFCVDPGKVSNCVEVKFIDKVKVMETFCDNFPASVLFEKLNAAVFSVAQMLAVAWQQLG